MFYENLEKILDLINKYTTDNAKELKAVISNDKDLERELWENLRSLHWFYWAKDAGYFDPKQIEFDEKGNSYFWNVLRYLERVSEQVVRNSKYGNELIDIIENIVQFSLTQRCINHFQIWRCCLRILNNIPNKIVKDNLSVKTFRTWLEVWMGHSDLIVSDMGTELLPKFLQNDFAPDYKYAETLIKIMTEIKAKKEGNDAILAYDKESYWIKDTFNKHSELIGKRCSIEIVFDLADKLRRSLEYKRKTSYCDVKINKSVYRIRVERIPVEGIKSGEIKFKDAYYKCVVKQFSNDQLKKNDYWISYYIEPKTQRGEPFDFTAKEEKSFVREIKKRLTNDIIFQDLEELEDKLLNIYRLLYSDNSYISCRSLENGPEYVNNAEDILTVILRDVLLVKCKTAPKESDKVLTEFLMDKYGFSIFRRFILLGVDKVWNNYSNKLLDKLIEVVPDILENPDFEVEIYAVFSNHNGNFTKQLKSKIKKLIKNVPDYLEKDTQRSIEWQYEWLSPLRNNKYFSDWYQETKQKVKPKDDKSYKPERVRVSEFREIIHKSPLSKEEILQKSIPELVQYLTDLKDVDIKDVIFEDKPDKEGLGKVLHEVVKDNPKRFTNELKKFEKHYFWLNYILWGIKDAWNSGKDIDWKNVFDFCIEYFSLGKDAILKEAHLNKEKDEYLWVVNNIVGLIEDGSNDDKRAFPPEYFDRVEQIFDLIIPLLKGEKEPDIQRDALTYALNTTLGRTIRAYIKFSLRVARVRGKKKENWGSEKYERFLPIGIEGYIWFGCFFPYMKYLDKDYTEKKIDLFAKINCNNFEWNMFMEGYLNGSTIYKDLYLLMRKNYLNALQSTVLEESTVGRLVVHICLGYLDIGELLEEKNKNGQPSLFWKMLNEVSGEQRSRWIKVANFFWSKSGKRLDRDGKDNKEESSKNYKKKIIAFWKWTVENQAFVENKLGDKYPLFLSKMAELIIWLDKIDAIRKKWIILSAPFISVDYGLGLHFFEYLTKFEDDESLKHIGKIFLKVLENTTPTYKQEDIKLIVKRLYKLGEKNSSVKDDADKICNIYGRRGVHFLKDLYFENKNF